MAQTWNDPSLPWQTWNGTNHPWKNTAMAWNNPSLPWKDGSWVLPGFTVDMDFENGRYFGVGLSGLTFSRAAGTGTVTSLLPTSAAGAAYSTYGTDVIRIVPGLGLIFESGPKTNSLINSFAPVTQTTGSLATGTYAASGNCNSGGSFVLSVPTANIGNITLVSGTATGGVNGGNTNFATVSHGAPVVFSIATAASTVTATVSGTVNAFQIENNGWPTSFIQTGASVGNRANEFCDFTTLPTGASTGQGTLFGHAIPHDPDNTNPQPAVIIGMDANDATNNSRAQIFRRSTGGFSIARGVVDLHADLGSDVWTYNTAGKIAMSVAAGAQSECFNGGTVSTGTDGLPSLGCSIMRIGKGFQNNTVHWFGIIKRVAYSPLALTGAQLQLITTL